MAGLPGFNDGRSMAAAVCGMPEEETMTNGTSCLFCGGPLVDGRCARQIAHGSCAARVRRDSNRAEAQAAAVLRREPPPDLVAEALALARGGLPESALDLRHLQAIVGLLEQRNETIRELLKP